ncbi:MAG TPA: hypothetical protein ENG45_00510 [Candidatus Aenigmarchaeota archaeon]|nr:hypothetical protein [Candidatus Aenigmarchaeota archaeon]
MYALQELRERFKKHIIERGLKSISTIRDKEKRNGAREGFQLCFAIDKIEDYEKTYNELRNKATEMVLESCDEETIKKYWRIVYKAEQVNFVYQRLKAFDVLFGLIDKTTVSATAMLDTVKVLNEILRVW